jgi:hypothetical protein
MGSNTPADKQQALAVADPLLQNKVPKPEPEKSADQHIDESIARLYGKPFPDEEKDSIGFLGAVLDSEFWARDLPRNAWTATKNMAANIAGMPSDVVGLMTMVQALDPVKGAMIKSRLGVDSVWDIPGKIPGNSEQIAELIGGDPNHPSFLATGLVAPGPGELIAGGKAMFVGAIASRRSAKMTAKLDEFLTMEKKGKIYDEELWEKTGWYRGPDGQPRFFISDAQAEVFTGNIRNKIPTDLSKWDGKPISLELQEVLKHDELFELYPELAGMRIQVSVIPDGKGGFKILNRDRSGTGGNIATIGNTVTRMNVYNATDEVALRKIVLHEVQHVIQTIEGWAGGTSVKAMADTHIKNLVLVKGQKAGLQAIREGANSTDELFLKLVEGGMDDTMAASMAMDSQVQKYLAATVQGDTDFVNFLDAGVAGEYEAASNMTAHLVHYLGLNKESHAQELVNQLSAHKGIMDDVRMRAYLMSYGEAEARLTERMHTVVKTPKMPKPEDLPDVAHMMKEGKTLSLGELAPPGRVVPSALVDVPIVDVTYEQLKDSLSSEELAQMLQKLVDTDPAMGARVLSNIPADELADLPPQLQETVSEAIVKFPKAARGEPFPKKAYGPLDSIYQLNTLSLPKWQRMLNDPEVQANPELLAMTTRSIERSAESLRDLSKRALDSGATQKQVDDALAGVEPPRPEIDLGEELMKIGRENPGAFDDADWINYTSDGKVERLEAGGRVIEREIGEVVDLKPKEVEMDSVISSEGFNETAYYNERMKFWRESGEELEDAGRFASDDVDNIKANMKAMDAYSTGVNRVTIKGNIHGTQGTQELEFLKNPTETSLRRWAAKSLQEDDGYKAVRVVTDVQGNLYVWDANKALHNDFIKATGMKINIHDEWTDVDGVEPEDFAQIFGAIKGDTGIDLALPPGRAVPMSPEYGELNKLWDKLSNLEDVDGPMADILEVEDEIWDLLKDNPKVLDEAFDVDKLYFDIKVKGNKEILTLPDGTEITREI